MSLNLQMTKAVWLSALPKGANTGGQRGEGDSPRAAACRSARKAARSARRAAGVASPSSAMSSAVRAKA